MKDIKIVQTLSFLSKWFTKHFIILEHFLSNLRSEKIAWVKIVKKLPFFKENMQFKTNKSKEFKLFFTKRLTLKRGNQ